MTIHQSAGRAQSRPPGTFFNPMKSDFDILNEMAMNDKDIRMFPTLVSAQMAAAGGHLTFGCDRNTLLQLSDENTSLIAFCYVINNNQFEELKNKPDSAAEAKRDKLRGALAVARGDVVEQVAKNLASRKEVLALKDAKDELIEDLHATREVNAELLAALKKAVQDYGQPGGPWNVPSEPGSWIVLATAAIAKASGQKEDEAK